MKDQERAIKKYWKPINTITFNDIIAYYFWPIGGADTKLMWCGVCEVTVTHTKFGVNMPKPSRDKASDAVWHYANKFVDALNENVFVYWHEIHTFLQA